MGAATPLIITCTPFRMLGNGALVLLVVGASPVPTKVRNSPGDTNAVNGAELAAFATPTGLRYTPEEALTTGPPWNAIFSPIKGPMPYPMRIVPSVLLTYSCPKKKSVEVPSLFNV